MATLGVGTNLNTDNQLTFNNQDISQLGYNLGLPGMGISLPVGTPYNVYQTPAAVYGGYAAPGYKPGDTTVNQSKVPDSQKTTVNSQTMPFQEKTATVDVTNSGQSGGPNINDIVNAMMSKGYNDRNAAYAIASGDPSKYAREYLGQGSQGSDAYSEFLSKNPYSDISPAWNPADFENELNSVYNQALDFANKQKEFAGQSNQSNIADINNQFGVSKETLDTSKGQTMGTLGESEIGSRQRQEQSLDAIRRLYNEMTMGYQQRFGGASSAGEAAKALAGQEMQRQMGTTRQSTGDALRQIENQKVQVEQNYKNSLLDLENKKNTAINESNRNFQSAMLSIDNDVKVAANEKALAKMNLLKEYKTDLFNIKQQEAAWKANLESMKYQADLQTESALKQMQGAGSTGTTAYQNLLNQTSTSPTSNLGVNNSYNPTTQMNYTGQIGDDELKTNFLQGAVSKRDQYF
jgi:hypothetical protein